jgi:opacity protein-like surface antigen
MIKRIGAALLCTALSTSLYAGDGMGTKGFLGLEVGAASVKADRYYDFGYEGDAVEYGLRLGAQSDEWRTTFAYDHYDSSDDDQNIEKVFAMIDYFFMKSDVDTKVKPFIGVNIGYANYESTFVDDSDFFYGGQVGVVVGLIENIDVDLSYRYSLSNSDILDNMGSFVFGISYLY